MASGPKKFRAEKPDEDSDISESANQNLIRVKVNVKDLTRNGVESDVKRINGFPWVVKVYHGRDNYITAIIVCEKSAESEVWECEVEGEVKLINHTDDKHSISEELNANLCYGNSCDSFCLAEFDDAVKDQDFIIDGSIVIEAKIVVEGRNGDRFRKRTQIDFFSPSKFSDAILSVGGKKLHVSKQILAHASSYFNSYFFRDLKWYQRMEIDLDDISVDEFVTTLELIYGTRDIEGHNVEYLLKMADRFDIPKIMISAEEWLIDSFHFPMHFMLRLSDQYSLYGLQHEKIREIDNSSDADELTNSDSYKHFSSELKDEIIHRMIESQMIDSPELDIKWPTSKDPANEHEDPEVDLNVIQMRVENVKDLSIHGIKSEMKTINGFPWQLKVYRSKCNILFAHIECDKSRESPIWACEVEGEVKLICHDDDTASICTSFKQRFMYVEASSSKNSCDIYLSKWNTIIGNRNFIIDEGIEVAVMINVKGRSGDRFRKNPRTNLFSPSKFSDIIFVVGEWKLYASKQILAHASLYFEQLFFGDFEKPQDKEIIMEDVSFEEFLVALEMIYHTRREFDDSNVDFLLRMADRFMITKFLDRAEKWLIDGSAFPMHTKLRLADQYKLEVLKSKCLSRVNFVQQVAELKNSDSYNDYSSELKDELIKKLVQLWKRHGN